LIKVGYSMADSMQETSPPPEAPEAELPDVSPPREQAAPDPWEERYAELAAYQAQCGHCRVPREWAPYASLVSWMRRQRRMQFIGRMKPEHEARLEALGFRWVPDMLDNVWEGHFQRLKAYHEEHGHLGVLKAEDAKLSHWIALQRNSHKNDRLSAKRRQRLESIGFHWSQHEARKKNLVPGLEESWGRMSGLLEKHIAQEGPDSIVALSLQSSHLGRWLWNQRRKARLGQLSPECRARLEAAGALAELDAVKPPVDWQARYAELRDFSQKHGHTRGEGLMEQHLRRWCHEQRLAQKNNRLEPAFIALLDELDFEWGDWKPGLYGQTQSEQRAWISHYKKLRLFHRKHGHSDVPHYDKGCDALYRWANIQRIHQMRGLLSPQQEALLAALNFRLGVEPPENHDAWETYYAKLKALHQEQGHLRMNPKHDPMLAHWSHLQVCQREEGTLSAEKIAKLDALGFRWVPADSNQPLKQQHPSTVAERRWDRHYRRLYAYHQQHGHCKVPLNDLFHGRLAQWVLCQRYNLKEGKLSAAEVALLAELGFE